MANDGEYNKFIIRYGPATIFSGGVPALDANFITPKYTEDNPYKVTETPGYIEDPGLTEELNNSFRTDKIKELDKLVQKTVELSGDSFDENSKKNINIVLNADNAKFDEYQVLILYKDNCIICEGGRNTVEKRLSQVMRNADSGNDAISKNFTYNELIEKVKTDEKWKEAVNDAIRKKENLKWFSNKTKSTETVILKNRQFKPNDKTPEGSSNECKNHVNQLIKQYEYDNAIFKSGSYPNYKWTIEKNGKRIYYEYNGSIIINGRTSEISDTLIKTEVEESNMETGQTKVSTAYELRETISKWYIGLRTIALVGLLSVLVYVGIRIIISSTGQEKAKYKKSIIDWITAICILFVLHYIMAFTMTIVDNIIQIFTSENIIGNSGEDVLMSSIRGNINTSGSFAECFADLILYIVLIVYTVMFTVHYLKRLVYLAFFTMIAPLIALTYPLDKIKDRSSTSFYNVDKGIYI